MAAVSRAVRAMSTASSAGGRCLVIGGSGALGRAVVAAFKAASWRTTSVDLTANAEADESVSWQSIAPGKGVPAWPDQVEYLASHSATGEGEGYGAIICAAGGWAGGDVSDLARLASSTESMEHVCLHPALVASAAASKLLRPSGLLVITGSAAALGPTPKMLAYGMMKAATHHLAVSLAVPDSGLPAGARVLAVTPRVIDTPSNRQWMAGPGVDTGAWTPPEHIAQACVQWAGSAAPEAAGGAASTGGSANAIPDSPPSGSLCEPVTAAGSTQWTVRSALYNTAMDNA